jgi:hypothetical protein
VRVPTVHLCVAVQAHVRTHTYIHTYIYSRKNCFWVEGLNSNLGLHYPKCQYTHTQTKWVHKPKHLHHRPYNISFTHTTLCTRHNHYNTCIHTYTINNVHTLLRIQTHKKIIKSSIGTSIPHQYTRIHAGTVASNPAIRTCSGNSASVQAASPLPPFSATRREHGR